MSRPSIIRAGLLTAGAAVLLTTALTPPAQAQVATPNPIGTQVSRDE